VKEALANGGDVNGIIEQDGWHPLHAAADRHNKEIVELLLAKGAKVNAKGGFFQETPLHVAADRYQLAIAEVLIAHGADVNAKNKDGQTPLFLARTKNAKKIIALLKKHGAK